MRNTIEKLGQYLGNARIQLFQRNQELLGEPGQERNIDTQNIKSLSARGAKNFIDFVIGEHGNINLDAGAVGVDPGKILHGNCFRAVQHKQIQCFCAAVPHGERLPLAKTGGGKQAGDRFPLRAPQLPNQLLGGIIT